MRFDSSAMPVLGPLPEPAPQTPPEAPLDMPAQPVSAGRVLVAGEADGRWRLVQLVAGAAMVTCLAVVSAWASLNVDGVSPIEWLGLALLGANIAWISLAGATAFAGAIRLAMRRPHAPMQLPFFSSSRTAIIFPIRNEPTERISAVVRAMHDALVREGVADGFEFFLLSDTLDADHARAEELALQRLRETCLYAPVFYRRRTVNHGRKAGNVADFVRRWGGRYDYMAVMDADSMMSADALKELVHRMDAQPRTALIQTVPTLVNANTFVARSQQFAMRAYGRIFGEGLAWWSGGAGNFWGHNAIIRVSAFAAHAGLPILPGKGPLGGHILSHDFVEAALLRRAGWRVEIAPEIEGSFEESPPTLDDLLTRDRRWAQGNLQHIKLIGAGGFDAASRAHMLAGVMGYASALTWLALILVSALAAWLHVPEETIRTTPMNGMLPLVTVLIVLAPKWLALLLWATGKLPGWGRHRGFVVGLVTETVVSAAMAPILMVGQAKAVLAPFFGRDAGWRPQARVACAGAPTGLRYRSQLTIGALLGVTMLIDPRFVAWTLPVALSLVLAGPISTALSLTPQRRSLAWRLMATPEDLRIPAIVRETNRGSREIDRQPLPLPARGIIPVVPLAQLTPARTDKTLEVSV